MTILIALNKVTLLIMPSRMADFTYELLLCSLIKNIHVMLHLLKLQVKSL
jgi:hypothetical protein